MATAQSTAGSDWMKSQQQYWDSWFEQQRNAFGALGQATTGGHGPHGLWNDFFREWQGAISGGQQAPNADSFSQYFVKAGETYMNMLQQFYQGTGQAKPLDQMTQEWTDSLQKFFSGNLQPGNFQFGKDPLSALDPLGFFASMPGIGYTREKQEQMNHLYQQWAEYERKSRDYNAGMAKVGLEAVQKFQEYLANPPKDKEPLKSLKEVYTKWVDVCEEIYAAYAMTEEYTTLYGEVVNALMNFKKQQNKALDDMVEQFNLPTRQEVDSLHERLHALRRDNLQMKKDIAALQGGKKSPAPAKLVKIKPAKIAKKGKKK